MKSFNISSRTSKEILIIMIMFLILLHEKTVYAQWIKISFPSLWISCITVVDTDIYVGTYGTIYCSHDNGTTWTPGTGLPNTKGVGNVINIVSNGSSVFANMGLGGVYRSINTIAWTSYNIGLIIDRVDFIAATKDNVYSLQRNNMLYMSPSNVASWKWVHTFGLETTWNIDRFTCLTAIDTILLAGGYDQNNLCRSKDKGVTWQVVLPGWAPVSEIVADGNNLYFFGKSGYGGGGGFFHSTDVGSSWTQINTNCYSLLAVGGNIFIAAGTGLPSSNKIQRSIDKGNTWIDISSGIPANRRFQSLAIKNNMLFAAFTTATDTGDCCPEIWAMPIIIAPVLTSPSNNAVNQPSSIPFSWGAVAAANSYTLQISTDSSFSTTIYNQSNITGTSQIISNLAYSTNYYWRVNATNLTGIGAWSNKFQFKTTIATPTPFVPENKSISQTTSVSFIWSTVQTALFYTLQVSSDSLFSSTVFSQSNLTATSQVVNSLVPGITYYWRVSATNSDATSNWSALNGFTISPNTNIDISRVKNLSNQFDVYPIPSTGIINIQLPNNGIVKIYSTDGKLIRLYKNVSSVRTESLKNGVYIISAKQGKLEYKKMVAVTR